MNYRVPEEEERKKGSEKMFEEIIVENFPNMGKEIVNQVLEAQRGSYRINPRRNMPRHILIKLSKIKYKENILGASLVAQWLRICLLMRGHRFEPWSGKIPQATEQLGP